MMKNIVLDQYNELVQNDSRLIPGASPSAGEGQIYHMVKNELRLLKYYYMHTIEIPQFIKIIQVKQQILKKMKTEL